MVHCLISAKLLAPLKQWELCNPYETVFVFLQQSKLICDLKTKCAKYIIDKLALICCKEQ